MVRIFGSDPDALFKNSIYAVASLMHNLTGLSLNTTRRFNIAKVNGMDAIVEIANSIIAEFELNNSLFYSIEKIGKKYVELSGHKFSRNVSWKNVLKAATYHTEIGSSNGYVDLTLDI